ncbi:MAG: outer membrane beta-barrel protein [Panacagrimonas sp.]
MKRNLIAAVAACSFAVPAIAQTGNNYIDGFFVLNSEIDFEPGGDDDGNGFGLKGAFQVHKSIFLTGEYQGVEYDDSNADLDQIRLGAAFGPGAGAASEGIYGRAQYIDLDLDGADDQDGFGGHVGYALPVNKQFHLHGEAGYVLLDDLDGPELLVGATYKFTPNIGAFADYRMSFLDVDGAGDLDLNDLRVGARFYF